MNLKLTQKSILCTTLFTCTLLFIAACTPNNQTKLSSDKRLPSAYGKIYEQTVKDQADDNIVFSLILLDHDEIPELVVYDQYYENLSIYTIKENKMFCLLDSMHAAEVTYFEKTGILAKFSRWNGGGDEGGYGWYYYQTDKEQTLTEDSTPVLYETYDAVYDDKGEFTGKGVTHYYRNEREIDEKMYLDERKKLGIDDSGVSCTKDAAAIDEVIKLINN